MGGGGWAARSGQADSLQPASAGKGGRRRLYVPLPLSLQSGKASSGAHNGARPEFPTGGEKKGACYWPILLLEADSGLPVWDWHVFFAIRQGFFALLLLLVLLPLLLLLRFHASEMRRKPLSRLPLSECKFVVHVTTVQYRREVL